MKWLALFAAAGFLLFTMKDWRKQWPNYLILFGCLVASMGL